MLNASARTEPLLKRAVDLARTRPGGLRQVDWALMELAQIRGAAGDLEGASLGEHGVVVVEVGGGVSAGGRGGAATAIAADEAGAT